MAADGQGNDLAQVGVPIGGLIAFAPHDTVGGVLSDADLGATPVTLPSGYKMLGLVKQDGAPQHAREAGDAIEFWQGQPSRLHDRVRYHRDAGGWTRGRLAP